MPRAHTALLIGLLFLAGCHSQETTVRLADGTERTFEFEDGVPLPSSNEWGQVTVAGASADINDGRVLGYQSFAFRSSIDDLSAVRVFDVTRDAQVLLVEDTDVTLADDMWVGQTEPREIGPDHMPWAMDGRTDTFFYKFVLENGQGERRTLYQPAVINKQFDEDIRRMRAARRAGTSSAEQ